MTQQPFSGAFPKAQEMCASAGVAVVIVPELPKTRVNGATRWLSKDKALLQLSLRYQKEDIFWFSFFHEAAHIHNQLNELRRPIDSEVLRAASIDVPAGTPGGRG